MNEQQTGADMVALLRGLPHELAISVVDANSVRLRIRGADGDCLADIATTPARALRIAGLLRLAALRADPSLKLVQIEGAS